MLVRLFPSELLCLENNSTTNNINDTFLIIIVAGSNRHCLLPESWLRLDGPVDHDRTDSVRLLECTVCTIVTSINGQRHQRYRISQVTFASVLIGSHIPASAL